MKLLLDDADMDAQLQRTVTAANAGAADLGEVIATALRVQPGDYDSWYDEWSAVAERSASAAQQSLDGGHRVSARKAFLRASEYWRQAFFFLRHDIEEPRLQHAWRQHRATFRSALPLLDGETTVAEIPFEGASMTAYRFHAAARATSTDASAAPVVVAPCGYDSTAESGYVATAYMALDRGYDCFIFEGPGQGGMLYEHKVPMRADFEVPMAAALDWLLAQPGVDPERVAVFGRSLGGYLAPRAAASEPRIKALICDPGQVEYVSRMVGTLIPEDMWQKILAKDPATDADLQGLLDGPRNTEWFGARMATMGCTTVGDFLRTQVDYTIEHLAPSIACPTLVTEGEGDFASQSAKLMDLLTCPKQHRLFTEAEGGGGHCEGLGQTLVETVVFDWLDDTFAR